MRYNYVAQCMDMIADDAHLIKSDLIRGIVQDELKLIPKKFWELGASSSCKYHPLECRFEDGLAVHTHYTVQAALVLMDADAYYDRHPGDRDLVIAACILHDAHKYGPKNAESHTTSDHPEEMADYLSKKAAKLILGKGSNKVKPDTINTLLSTISEPSTRKADWFKKALVYQQLSELILTHHGKWSNKRKPKTTNEKLVHAADMIASRAHLIRDHYLEGIQRDMAEQYCKAKVAEYEESKRNNK